MRSILRKVFVLGVMFGFGVVRVAWRRRAADRPVPDPPNPGLLPNGDKATGDVSNSPDLPDSPEPPDNTDRVIEGDTGKSPIVYGGHHRQDDEDKVRVDVPNGSADPAPRIGLACFDKRPWIIGLKVELSDEERYVEVRQGGNKLGHVNADGTVWALQNLKETVIVSWGAGSKSRKRKVDLKRYTLDGIFPFRLWATGSEVGRYSKTLSPGLHLLFCPTHLHPSDSEANPPHSECEESGYRDYVCHFYDLTSDVVFFDSDDSDKKEIRLTYGQQRFTLEGDSPDILSADGPPLYLGAPPMLRDRGEKPWCDIQEIVVGEEGPGKDKWRASFAPKLGQEGQSLEKILSATGGWFFTRLYKDKQLLHSTDFRFHRDLKRVEVSPEEHVPPPGGYSATSISFVHAEACKVSCLHERASELNLESTPTGTTAALPAHRDFDRSRWAFRSNDDAEVKFALDLDRTWWSLERPGSDTVWTAQPLMLSRDDFGARSKAVVRLDVAAHFGAKHVCCRLNGGEGRRFIVLGGCSEVAIDLKGFADCAVLDQPGSHSLIAEIEEHALPVGALTVYWCCRECGQRHAHEDALWGHVKTDHLPSFYKAPTYDEAKEIYPQLPGRITECRFCGRWLPSDQNHLADYDVKRHVEYECQKRLPGQSPIIRIVDDLDEIREKLYKDLPDVRLCLFCKKHFEKDDLQGMLEHLKACHAKRVWSPA